MNIDFTNVFLRGQAWSSHLVKMATAYLKVARKLWIADDHNITPTKSSRQHVFSKLLKTKPTYHFQKIHGIRCGHVQHIQVKDLG